MTKLGKFLDLDWRIETIVGLKAVHKSRLRSQSNQIGSYLKRFLTKYEDKISYINNLHIPDWLSHIYYQLPSEERACFDRIQKKNLKRQRLKNVTFRRFTNIDKTRTSYRIKDLESIGDEGLIRI